MSGMTVQQPMARAEDKATVGTDLSADPGAKTERRAMDSSVARLTQIPFGIGSKAINPAGRSPASWITETPGDGLPDVANSDRPELHFTLNQYTARSRPLGLSRAGQGGKLGVCPSNDLYPHQRVLSCSKTYLLDTESTLRRLSE